VIAETADVLLCYLIPCLIVVVLNLIIAAKVRRADRGFQQTPTTEHGTVIQSRNSRRQTGRGRAPSASSSTRILLVVPIVYIVLNTPFYLIRMAETILLNIFKSQALSIQGGLKNPVIIALYNGAHYLYFVNFASDVIVYAFSSANFRKTAVIAWKRILWPSYDGHVNKAQVNKFSYKYSSTSMNPEHRSSYTNLRGALNGRTSPKGNATAAL
uniref:G_PROTEIN_RECEP_F1_2 domain-containing protein n=1 Tax=Steinernema glaseri TaxID=37863 RepID=A0A1I8AIE6_9BILA